jgi:hypothetical protein
MQIPQSYRLFAPWELREAGRDGASSAPRFALVGRSVDDFERELSTSRDNPLREVLLWSAEGQMMPDEISGGPLFLPSARFAALVLRRAESLLKDGVEGIVFWQTHLPATNDAIKQVLAEGLGENMAAPDDDEATTSSPAQPALRAYQTALLATDRVTAGIRDLARRQKAAAARVWVGTVSWPAMLERGSIAPFFGLGDLDAIDGLFVALTAFPRESLGAIPTVFRPTTFEWTFLQAQAANGAAELLRCPLVLAPLEDDVTTEPCLCAAAAAYLTGANRRGLALGFGQISTVAAPSQASAEPDICSDVAPMWPVLANLFSQARPRATRWNSGTREIALAVGDGALLSPPDGHEQGIVQVLAVWLPCFRQGIAMQVLPFAALAEPRIADSIGVTVTSFSFQTPREEELWALGGWVKRGGTLVLLDSGRNGRPPLKAASNDGTIPAVETTATAQQRLLITLGLPPAIPDGAYRVGDGWLFFSALTPGELVRRSNTDALPRLLQQVAGATRRSLAAKPQFVVYRDSTVAGWMAPDAPNPDVSIPGEFVDLTTTSLRLRTDPEPGAGEIVLLQRLANPSTIRAPRFVAANVPVVRQQASGGDALELHTLACETAAGGRLLLQVPRPGYLPFDAETANMLDVVWHQESFLLDVGLCPETRGVTIRRAP